MTTAHMKTYAVHCFASVRVRMDGITAPDHREAIQQAMERFDWEELREQGEFADEFVEFLVDVEGDDEHRQSRWFDPNLHQVTLDDEIRTPRRVIVNLAGGIVHDALAADPWTKVIVVDWDDGLDPADLVTVFAAGGPGKAWVYEVPVHDLTEYSDSDCMRAVGAAEAARARALTPGKE